MFRISDLLQFNGMPTDVIAYRLCGCLSDMVLKIYPQGQRQRSYHESFLKFTHLEELSLSNYFFTQEDSDSEETIFTPPNLRRLYLKRPRNLSSSDISRIGRQSPNLTFLYVKDPCYVLDDVDFRTFSNLEELCIPQSMLFSILTDRLPPSLKKLRIPVKEPMAVGFGDDGEVFTF